MLSALLPALVIASLAAFPTWAHSRDVEFSVVRQVPHDASPETARLLALEAVLQQASDETPRLFLRESTLHDGKLTERARLVGLSLFTVTRQDVYFYVDGGDRRNIRLEATVRFDDDEMRRRLAVVQDDFESGGRFSALVAENQVLRAQLLVDPVQHVDGRSVLSRSGAVRHQLASVFAPGALLALALEDGESWRAFCAAAREQLLVPLALAPKTVTFQGVRNYGVGQLSALVSVTWPAVDAKLISALHSLVGKPAARRDGAVLLEAPEDGSEASRRARFLADSRVHLEIHVGSGTVALPILVGVDGFNAPVFNFATNAPYTPLGDRRVGIVDGRTGQAGSLPRWMPSNPVVVAISEADALRADRVRAFVVISTPDGIVTRQQIPI